MRAVELGARIVARAAILTLDCDAFIGTILYCFKHVGCSVQRSAGMGTDPDLQQELRRVERVLIVGHELPPATTLKQAVANMSVPYHLVNYERSTRQPSSELPITAIIANRILRFYCRFNQR